MRILILGAGAIGGYYGGRLVAAGRDVTFLVRPPRAENLRANGLVVESARAPIAETVKTITTVDGTASFDAVVLSCKAYDLDSSIAAIAPAVGERTCVLPLLNGLAHLGKLDAAFGSARVLGGTCHISVTLSDEGAIRHMNEFDILTLGPRDPCQFDDAKRLHTVLSGAGFDARLADNGEAAMWEKWILIATLAGMTCLMRANIGEIVATRGGADRIARMLEECCAVAAASGQQLKSSVVLFTRSVLTDPASKLASSMLRDLQRGTRIEADHILGDLVARGAKSGVPTPLLDTAYAHLQAYQNRL